MAEAFATAAAAAATAASVTPPAVATAIALGTFVGIVPLATDARAAHVASAVDLQPR